MKERKQMKIWLILINAIITAIISWHLYHRMAAERFQVQSNEMKSYKTKKKIKSKIEQRYITQTFLESFIQMDELVLFYLIWCVLCLSLAAIFSGFISLGLILLPIVLLEYRLDKIDLSIDRSLLQLLSQVNARLAQSEDLMAALRASQNHIDNPYIKKTLIKFNQSIRLGLSPQHAFQSIQATIHNDYFKYVFLNIEQVYLRRGNVSELMRAIENEYTSIQIEVNKRKLELTQEKHLTLLSIVLLLFITLKIMNDQDYIKQYLSAHPYFMGLLGGFVLMGLLCLIKAAREKT